MQVHADIRSLGGPVDVVEHLGGASWAYVRSEEAHSLVVELQDGQTAAEGACLSAPSLPRCCTTNFHLGDLDLLLVLGNGSTTPQEEAEDRRVPAANPGEGHLPNVLAAPVKTGLSSGTLA